MPVVSLNRCYIRHYWHNTMTDVFVWYIDWCICMIHWLMYLYDTLTDVFSCYIDLSVDTVLWLLYSIYTLPDVFSWYIDWWMHQFMYRLNTSEYDVFSRCIHWCIVISVDWCIHVIRWLICVLSLVYGHSLLSTKYIVTRFRLIYLEQIFIYELTYI